MKTNILKHLSHSASYAVLASLMILSLVLSFFFIAEPAISYGQSDTATFTIKQTITDETSFLVPPTNVVATGTINGVTGGTATGTTVFAVISNNAAGYRVDIQFEDTDLDRISMRGDVSDGNEIHDYSGDVAGQPSYNFTASSAAQLAYTVTSSTTNDTDNSFLTNGSNACNTAPFNDGAGIRCWKAASTTAPFTIVDRDTSAVTGATSTIKFIIHVPNGATPVPQAETYTATATLSLYIN